MKSKFAQNEIERSEKALNRIGISMREDDLSFRPFNEVLMDMARTLRELRKSSDKKQFDLVQTTIYRTLLGVRYEHELR